MKRLILFAVALIALGAIGAGGYALTREDAAA